jgi:hypothetical protein
LSVIYKERKKIEEDINTTFPGNPFRKETVVSAVE